MNPPMCLSLSSSSSSCQRRNALLFLLLHFAPLADRADCTQLPTIQALQEPIDYGKYQLDSMPSSSTRMCPPGFASWDPDIDHEQFGVHQNNTSCGLQCPSPIFSLEEYSWIGTQEVLATPFGWLLTVFQVLFSLCS